MSCKVMGCERRLFADGYCGPHYKRKWRHGDPLVGGTFQGLSVADRIAGLIDKQPDGCWRWVGGLDSMGYGTMVIRRRTWRAHRASYEAFVGPIPDGLDIDHLCRVKACVNPAHLEPVTHSENLTRYYAGVTSCPHGHAYDERNTYRDTAGKRRCRTCLRERQRVRRSATR